MPLVCVVTTSQTKNYAIELIHEAIVDKTVGTTVVATKGPPPPASRPADLSTAVNGTTASNEYGGMEGRNVVSRTSVIYFANRSSFLRTNID